MPKAPMPTNVRLLRGERKDRINLNEPKPIDADLTCPDGVTDAVREIWDYTVYHLKGMSLDKAIDRDSLLCYCEAVALHRWSSRLVHEQGLVIPGDRGGLIRNPAVSIQKDAANIVRQLGHEFGFTPSGRGGIRVGEANGSANTTAGASRLLTG